MKRFLCAFFSIISLQSYSQNNVLYEIKDSPYTLYLSAKKAVIFNVSDTNKLAAFNFSGKKISKVGPDIYVYSDDGKKLHGERFNLNTFIRAPFKIKIKKQPDYYKTLTETQDPVTYSTLLDEVKEGETKYYVQYILGDNVKFTGVNLSDADVSTYMGVETTGDWSSNALNGDYLRNSPKFGNIKVALNNGYIESIELLDFKKSGTDHWGNTVDYERIEVADYRNLEPSKYLLFIRKDDAYPAAKIDNGTWYKNLQSDSKGCYGGTFMKMSESAISKDYINKEQQFYRMADTKLSSAGKAILKDVVQVDEAKGIIFYNYSIRSFQTTSMMSDKKITKYKHVYYPKYLALNDATFYMKPDEKGKTYLAKIVDAGGIFNSFFPAKTSSEMTIDVKAGEQYSFDTSIDFESKSRYINPTKHKYISRFQY